MYIISKWQNYIGLVIEFVCLFIYLSNHTNKSTWVFIAVLTCAGKSFSREDLAGVFLLPPYE